MFNISFDFDETTKKVSNIKVVSQEKVDLSEPKVFVLDNKLQLTDSAISVIGTKSGDRIAINYWMVSNSETFPVIGKAEAFADSGVGNVLSKTNTVSFRGKQRETLLLYGDIFTIEPFKDKMFKLVPVIKESEENLDVEEKDLDVIDSSFEESVVDDLFNDDLPF